MAEEQGIIFHVQRLFRFLGGTTQDVSERDVSETSRRHTTGHPLKKRGLITRLDNRQ